MEIKHVKKKDTVSWLEGPEHCRKYIQTDKILFGMSELLPGQRGAKDAGHPNSHEIFYVVKGHVLLFIEEKELYYELEEGDAILMPEGVSHTLINVGEEKAILTWSQAPPHV